MLQMEEPIAHGYIILLGGNGGTGNDPNDRDEATLTLGFLALMEGNVLDACFGVRSVVSSKDTRGKKLVSDAKALIGSASDVNEGIQQVAVLAYRDGFRAVVRYQKRVGKLNCFTYCFRSKRYRREALADLKAAYVGLQEAIQATAL